MTLPPPPPPQGASPLATASCVLAVITLVLVVIQSAIMLMGKISPARGQPTTTDWMLGFAMLGSLCGGVLLGILGVILGLIALLQPGYPRQFALIGLGGNAALLLIFWVVVAVAS